MLTTLQEYAVPSQSSPSLSPERRKGIRRENHDPILVCKRLPILYLSLIGFNGTFVIFHSILYEVAFLRSLLRYKLVTLFERDGLRNDIENAAVDITFEN